MATDDQASTQLRNIEQQTGKSVDELLQAGLATGQEKHTALRKFFQDEYSLTYGNANALAILTRDKMKGAAGKEENFLGAQYSGKKEGLRPIYDKLAAEIEQFGDDVELAPKRTYVSLRRSKQFGLIQPSTATRVDVGLNLAGVEPTDRLEASGSFNAMVSHRVRLSAPDDIDEALIGWLRQAYDAA